MASKDQVESFRRGLQAVVELARADFGDLWAGIDASDPLAVRAFMERVMPDLVDTYGASAALIAADFYDEVAGGLGVAVPAVLDDSIAAGQVQASTRWALAPLFSADPDAAAARVLLEQVTDRLVKQAARNTIHAAAQRDGVRYGRVPSGRETCAFCLMLASRGPVYGSKSDAGGDGNRYHADCDCVPTPMRDERDYPHGYDPDALGEPYERAREIAASRLGRSPSAEEILHQMRQLGGVKDSAEVPDILRLESAGWPSGFTPLSPGRWRHILRGHGPGASSNAFAVESEYDVGVIVRDVLSSPALILVDTQRAGEAINYLREIGEQVCVVATRMTANGRRVVTAFPVADRSPIMAAWRRARE